MGEWEDENRRGPLFEDLSGGERLSRRRAEGDFGRRSIKTLRNSKKRRIRRDRGKLKDAVRQQESKTRRSSDKGSKRVSHEGI